MDTKKIITKEQKAQFKKLWDQKWNPDPIVVMCYEKPSMNYIFYGIAFDPEMNILSGYDNIHGFASYTLEEFQELKDEGEDFERIDLVKGVRLSRYWLDIEVSWDYVPTEEEEVDEDEEIQEVDEETKLYREQSMKNIAKKLFGYEI